MNEIILSSDQAKAKQQILHWFENSTTDQPIFRVFGYAGTGKTTVIKQVTKEIKGTVLYAAFTGKAALVMTKHGTSASTVHSLIYRPVLPDKQYYEELKRNLELAKESGNDQETKELYDLIRQAQELTYELNEESALKTAALLVLDECSLIYDEMLEDILSFDIPILVLGDPGQLPPIKGTGALITTKPDVMFTEIHRQALGNPIINMSFRARNGKPIKRGEYGDSSHIWVGDLQKEKSQSFDQILVGKNTTRRRWNYRMRELKGFKGTYPTPGDKLMCLRNKKKLGLFNGLQVEVTKVLEEYENFIEMKVATELGNEIIVRVLRAHFIEYITPGTIKALKWWDFQEAEEFDFGYAITVHKSMGSQWDNVGFYDDKFLNWKKDERYKWLYTGITRAAETITLMS